jgi:hypothetical protein
MRRVAIGPADRLYETPIPGIGVSFSNLITDQAYYFQSVLEARAS